MPRASNATLLESSTTTRSKMWGRAAVKHTKIRGGLGGGGSWGVALRAS
jgi:hypothetical protein